MEINNKHSDGGQDIFVSEIFGENYKGVFVDIGAQQPINHNNTYMLEARNGWTGLSFDIVDYSKLWQAERKNPFICANALTYDFKSTFEKYNLSSPIDYLSLDVEGDGDRVNCLKNVLKSGYDFKVITIEHDSYRGYAETERDPQRTLLKSLGYILVVQCDTSEDWWIHPKYITEEQYLKFLSVNTVRFDLFRKINIDTRKYYYINEDLGEEL